MKTTLALFVAALTLRCATIANGRFQDVPVTTDPAGASIRVHCGDVPADGGVTPATLKLRRNAPGCSITLAKPGFADRVVTFERQTSGWFWANLAFPGIVTEVAVELATGPPLFSFDGPASGHQVNGVGMVAGTALGMWIDHQTGAQYRLAPARVDVKLAP